MTAVRSRPDGRGQTLRPPQKSKNRDRDHIIQPIFPIQDDNDPFTPSNLTQAEGCCWQHGSESEPLQALAGACRLGERRPAKAQTREARALRLILRPERLSADPRVVWCFEVLVGLRRYIRFPPGAAVAAGSLSRSKHLSNVVSEAKSGRLTRGSTKRTASAAVGDAGAPPAV